MVFIATLVFLSHSGSCKKTLIGSLDLAMVETADCLAGAFVGLHIGS